LLEIPQRQFPPHSERHLQAATTVKFLELIKRLDPRVTRTLILMSSRLTPRTPMGRANFDPPAVFGLNPSAKDAPAGEDERVRSLVVDDG
jgi:hypothetical protein